MRMLLKANIPTEAGNETIKTGELATKMKQILDDLKPEAVYFAEDGGERTAYLVLDMATPSDLPRVAEPFFLAFNARVTARPAMTLDDLVKAGPAIDRAVKNYA
ncbi:MAG: hypothetical protein WA814_01935 [Candidatus Baltobacteraceae bacterium]